MRTPQVRYVFEPPYGGASWRLPITATPLALLVWEVLDFERPNLYIVRHKPVSF